MDVKAAGNLPFIGAMCLLLAVAPATAAASSPAKTRGGDECTAGAADSGGDLASLVLASLPGEKAHRALLETLLTTNPDDVARCIRESWPPAVSPEEKALVLASLPKEGEVRVLSKRQKQKVAAVEQILGVVGRSEIYEIKIIGVKQACLALYARTVLLISEPALNLLAADELQALAAHEAGHEYTWEEYYRAKEQNDCQRLRRVELLCDAIAILLLRHAGVHPGSLARGLEKQIGFNQLWFGLAQDEDRYPRLGDRKKFVNALSAWAVNDCIRWREGRP